MIMATTKSSMNSKECNAQVAFSMAIQRSTVMRMTKTDAINVGKTVTDALHVKGKNPAGKRQNATTVKVHTTSTLRNVNMSKNKR